ncbi:MAG: hypothetical protein ACM3ZA_05250 [Bacillota bacterium]
MWEVEEQPEPGPAVPEDSGSPPRHGFFKFTTARNRYWGGPAGANELIAAGLARRIGLEVADLELARIEGHLGVVSLVRPAVRRVNWRDLPAPAHRSILRSQENIRQFRAMLAFDAWTLNIDRGSGKNTIAYQPAADQGWRVYFIDHGHTLHGNYDRWRWGGPYRSRYWDDLWRYYSVHPSLRRYLRSYRSVAPFVRRIQQITPVEIRREVGAVPAELLTPRQARLITHLLLWRQKRLPLILRRWFHRRRAAT